MNDFLPKPVDTEALIQKMIHHLEQLPQDETSEENERLND